MTAAERWTEALAYAEERREALLAREPSGRDGLDLLEAELERACLAAALGNSRLGERSLAAASAAATAAGIAWMRDRGRVELPVLGRGQQRRDHPGGVREFPAEGVPMSPNTWLMAVGVCRALRDEAGLAVLGDPRLLERLGERGEAFWTPVGAALARPDAGTIGAARESLAKTVRAPRHSPGAGEAPAEPDDVALRVRPLLDLVAAGEQTAFDAALAAALRCHQEFFARQDGELEVFGLLALPVIGLAALGHDRGLAVRVGAGSLPPDLVRGAVRPLGTVRYHFPAGRLHRSEEATWFLDLEGFPRAGRAHGMRMRAGKMTATYTASNGPGLPEACLRVEPPPPAGGAEHRTAVGGEDLMDVGELVLTADLLSARAGDDRQRRAWLAEAADCLAAARARPEPRFVHERGWAAYRAEPGRFHPDRLAAVETAWREMLDEWEAGDARTQSGVSITVLRLRLEPMLQAIAVDRTGVALREMRPRDEDYAKTFTPGTVERARRRYEELWAGPLDFRHPDPEARVEIHVAPAGMLGDANELSRFFPGGYRSIAGLLMPKRVWAAWRYVTPGRTAGLSYDGLAWCDDHWAWFPKPYRLLAV
ncbi:Imm49 family immunity protein [Paractinoplanes rhizophilus]|uniref:Imm49 family immunity protein n=1 Tax=Paractinoplanes rhizophilus TaxID=1416877 RepID=A0ABW2HWW4_9ACTN